MGLIAVTHLGCSPGEASAWSEGREREESQERRELGRRGSPDREGRSLTTKFIQSGGAD